MSLRCLYSLKEKRCQLNIIQYQTPDASNRSSKGKCPLNFKRMLESGEQTE